MKLNSCLSLLLLVVFAHQQATCQHIILHDPSKQALRSAESTFTPEAATATLCAASGLVPPYVVDKSASEQVEGVVRNQVLASAPKAIVLLHLAGVGPDDTSFAKLQQSWGPGHTLRLDLQGSTSAGSLLQAANDVVAANPDAKVSVLDHSALKDCYAGSCLQEHLVSAMHHCGGKVHATGAADPAQQPKTGISGMLELPGTSKHVDLQAPAARLFALELASLQGSGQQLLQKLKQQTEEEQDQALAIYESTFVGLQAMASMYPKGSAEWVAAETALMDVLSHVISELKAVYGDDMLYQVAFLEDVPVPSGTATHLLDWKDASRRVLLERSGAGLLRHLNADEAASSKQYAMKATAYGVTLLLIWFTFGGIYCMVSMRFKQDSLLYGRTKAD